MPSQSIRLSFAVRPEGVVDEALLGRVLELPDDPDDRQRQDDRQVEDASGRSAIPRISRSSSTAKKMPIGVAMNISNASQSRLCVERRPEERVGREQVLVVLQPDDVGRRSRPPMPFQFVNERRNEAIVGPQIRTRSRNSGMPTISAEDDLVAAGQQAVATRRRRVAPGDGTTARRRRPVGPARAGATVSVARSATVSAESSAAGDAAARACPRSPGSSAGRRPGPGRGSGGSRAGRPACRSARRSSGWCRGRGTG